MILDRKIIAAYEILNLDKKKIFDYFNSSLKIYYNQSLKNTKENLDKKKRDNFQLCNKLYEKYLEIIYKKLSNYFGIDRNKKFYEILIGYWLLRIIHLSVDVVENYKNLEIDKSDTIVIEKFDYKKLINLNYSNFNVLTSQYSFNNQLISLFFEEVVPHSNINSIQIDRKVEDIKKNQSIHKKKNLISESFYFFQNLKNRIYQPDKIILSHLFFFPLKNKIFSYKEIFKSYKTFFNFLLTKRVNYLVSNKFDYSFENSKNEIDLKKRKLVFSFESRDLLENMINRAILYSFPIECFEKFKVYENKNFRNFKKIFNTGPHLADGNIKFSIADAVSNGSKLILKQVGGFYGVVKNFISQEFDFKVADKFMSWGWVDEDNLNVFPSTSNLGISLSLFAKNKKYFVKKKKIILVLANLFIPRREWGDRMQPEQFINYSKRNLLLLEKIDKKFKKELFVRPYHLKKDCLITNKFFKENYKFTNDNFYQNILESRLTICTYNSTTFLECFALNAPCVLFWDQKEWPLNENNKSINDFLILKENNILFDNSIELSEFINRNYEKIGEWWYGEKIQKIINNFKNKYIYSEN